MSKGQYRLLDAVTATQGAAHRLRNSVFDRRTVIEGAIATDQNTAEVSEALDAFVQRFQQVVEHMTHRLYPAIYRLLEGERAPFLGDLLTAFEGRGLLASADAWKTRLELRNRLVHEYPLNAIDRAAALRSAIEHSITMLDDLNVVLEAIETRKLLDDIK